MSLPSVGKRFWVLGALGAAAVALYACGAGDEPATAQNAAPAVDAAQPRSTAAVEGGVLYTVDTDASEIYWLLGKTGPAAAFGHVHVVSAETYAGSVTVDPENSERSRFELVFPVEAFVVDDPELRKRLGAEFEDQPSANDVTGTKTNMLSEGLLNAALFDEIRMSGAAPPAGGDKLPVEIEIVGRTFELELPGTVTVGEDAVEASGEFTLSHADLGLEPFTALGGAMAVADDIRFVYRIRAQRAPAQATAADE